jgi:hypothetical protein
LEIDQGVFQDLKCLGKSGFVEKLWKFMSLYKVLLQCAKEKVAVFKDNVDLDL